MFCLRLRYRSDYDKTYGPTATRGSSYIAPALSRARFLYSFKEWKWAENTNLERPKDDYFLQALVVDDTPHGAAFIDRPFRDLHWSRLQNGKLEQDLLDVLRRGIRRFRSNAAGGNS